MNDNEAGATPASYPLDEAGLAQAPLPAFVREKLRRLAAEYRLTRFRVERRKVQGERATLWCQGRYLLWFYLGGSAAWAEIDGAYTTFDRVPPALLPARSTTEEVWVLRLAGESEPYDVEVACLTLTWGEVKGAS